jgi:hypothetical protein
MRTNNILSGLMAFGISLIACSTAPAALLIKVDKSAQTLTVTRDGQTVHTWPVSTGRTGYATPSGSFTTFRMEAEHFSKEWDDAPMPHSVFFTKQGHAIHGSFDTKRLGSPASHGCVRLSPANAAKLFSLVQQEGLPNTQVVLIGSEQVALDRAKLRRLAHGERRAPDRLTNSDMPTGSIRTLQRPVAADPNPGEEYTQPVAPPRYGTSTPPYNRPRSYDFSAEEHQPPYAKPQGLFN